MPYHEQIPKGPNLLMTRVDFIRCLVEAVKEWTADMLFEVPPGDESAAREWTPEEPKTDAETESGEESEAEPEEEPEPQPKERRLAVYGMGLPAKTMAEREVPYLIVRYLTSKNNRESDLASVLFMAALYSEDDGKGGFEILRLMDRLTRKLCETEVIADSFTLVRSRENLLETTVYQPESMPYYIGEIETVWSLPRAERDLTPWRENLYF